MRWFREKLGRMAFLIICSAGLLPVPAVAGPTLLDSCAAISTPGAYKLTNNISASGDCFVIDAAVSGVTLDLNGHVVSGDGTGSAVLVPGGTLVRGLVVRNGS